MADPFHLTIASIFRDAVGYLPRYLSQVDGLLRGAGRAHLVWLEGDSRDGTRAQLERAAETFRERYGTLTTLTRYDTGGPLWPSIDHAPRWKQLASCWNRNMVAVQPSQIVVFAESDLIWQPETVWRLVELVDHRNAPAGGAPFDVVYGALFHQAGHFYDTHATVSAGQHWSIHPPFVPAEAIRDDRFVKVDSAGGLIVTRGCVIEQWCDDWSDDGCVLRFADHCRQYVDLGSRVTHP